MNESTIQPLSKDNIICMNNVLNELKRSKFTVQEQKQFSIYLSKVNPKDLKSREVRFYVSEYLELIGLNRLYPSELKKILGGLYEKYFFIDDNKGGWKSFHLFDTIDLETTENGEQFIVMSASEKMLQYLFNLKNYFKYPLWSVLNLKTYSQIRFYELLKQYEYKGERELSISEIKQHLCMDMNKSERIGDLKRLLDKYQKEFKKHTDICFEYRKAKTGNRGKWETIVFDIFKNENIETAKACTRSRADSSRTQTESRNGHGAAATPLHDLHPQKEQGTPLEGVKELHNSLDDLTAAAAPVPVGTPNRLQAPEPLPFSIAATPRGVHDLTESKPKRNETNEDIEILQDLYPEFTNADLQAFYVRLIKLEPNRHGTARVDYFIQLYKDIKARESHGNKIYNTPAYIIKCLDDRINNIM